MGVTDTKVISKQIDQQFKSIRKYHDQLYGEITLLEQKQTKKMFALIQKIVVDENQVLKIKNSLERRKQNIQFLVDLHSYYSCKIDYCSNFQKYFFLLSYSDHSLYNEMALRLQNRDPFQTSELLAIFDSYVKMLAFLKQQNQRYFQIISNHMIVFQIDKGRLKMIQQFFKCENNQRFSNDNFYYCKKNHLQQHFVYHSPEAFTLYCNKQTLQAKIVSRQESSVIFVLGMNFLECALLADLSAVYDFKVRKVRFDKLAVVINKLIDFYGQEIGKMIGQILSQNPQHRPTIQQLKNYNKTYPKRRKITIPKNSRLQNLRNKEQIHAP